MAEEKDGLMTSRPPARSFSPEQLAQIHIAVQTAVQPLHQAVGQLRYDLDENNAKTAQMYEMFSTAKSGLRLMGGVGTILKWGAGVAAAFVALWATLHGKPPTS
jgi:hypothetical protein